MRRQALSPQSQEWPLAWWPGVHVWGIPGVGVVLTAFVCAEETADRTFADRSESRFWVCH